MKNYSKILQNCVLFDEIVDSDILSLTKCLNAKVKVFDKNNIIFAEDSPADSIGIVLSGSVQIMQNDYYGNRTLLSEVGPSEMFAEAFACAGLKSIPVSVIAKETCEIMFINCNRILYSCSNSCSFHRKITFNLMKTLAMKNIVFHQKVEIMSKRSTKEKLMTFLLFQAKKHNSYSFDIPFDRQELADFLAVDRSGLSTVIGNLIKEGIIQNKKNHFELL